MFCVLVVLAALLLLSGVLWVCYCSMVLSLARAVTGVSTSIGRGTWFK